MIASYRKAFWFSAVTFALVTVSAGAGWLYGADMLALRVAQLPASLALDVLSEMVSVAGGAFLSTGIAAVLIVSLYARGRSILAARLATSFVLATIIEIALKIYLPVPPLPLEYLRSSGEEMIIIFPNPYPSGHMMRSAFLAGALALLWPARIVWIAAGVFLLAMAITRVYLGVHWTSDVVGGALLGVAALVWAFGHEPTGRSKARLG